MYGAGLLLCVATLALGEGPQPDYDRDGIPNIDDDCPTDPGNLGNRGCPGDPPPKRVDEPPPPSGPAKLVGSTIILERPIQFRTGSATLAKGNEDLIDGLVQVIGALAAGRHVIIRGHTDSVGSRLGNLDLSRRRAKSMAASLIAKGIDGARLRPDGVGPDVPIASNKTAAGRAKNRRVEFVIIDASR